MMLFPVSLPSSLLFGGGKKMALVISAVAIASSFLLTVVNGDCLLSSKTLNDEFLSFIEGAESIPLDGSCCQADVCGLACPAPVSEPSKGTYCRSFPCFWSGGSGRGLAS